jgi:(p)ppGpp synthase/HD superfamily hydrolase
MNYQSAEDLFAAVGYGETTVNKVLNKLKKPVEKKIEDNFHGYGKKASKKDIEGLEGLMYSFAMCCSPIPGEPIVGVVTRSKGVSVHRADCKTLETIPPERLMDIKWAGVNTNKTYTTTIRIETAEKLGLLKDVISAVSDNNTNIVNATVKTKNHVGIIEMGLELDNIDTLKKVIACIQSLPDVYSVKRIQTSTSMLKKSTPTKNQKNFRPKKNEKHKDK